MSGLMLSGEITCAICKTVEKWEIDVETGGTKIDVGKLKNEIKNHLPLSDDHRIAWYVEGYKDGTCGECLDMNREEFVGFKEGE